MCDHAICRAVYLYIIYSTIVLLMLVCVQSSAALGLQEKLLKFSGRQSLVMIRRLSNVIKDLTRLANI